jgi:hypothetical protein
MNHMTEINVNTPQKEINKTYRKLAKELHPDQNKAPDAHEKFELLVAAYEVGMLFLLLFLRGWGGSGTPWPDSLLFHLLAQFHSYVSCQPSYMMN